MATEKLKSHKSPGIYQIPAQLIKAGGIKICSEIHKRVNFVWIQRKCLRSGRSHSLYLFIRRVIKQIVVTTEAYHWCHPTYKIISNRFLSRLTAYAEEIIGNMSVGFAVTGQLLIICSVFVKYLRRNVNILRLCLGYLWTFRKPVIQLGGTSCVIFLLSLASLETCNSVRLDDHFSDTFLVKNGLKQGDALLPLLFNIASVYEIRRV